jgi:dTDP-4-dehydrorhamnose 3,5-epimerase-like enzyme
MIEIKSDKDRGDLIPIYPLEFGLNTIKRIMIFKNVPKNSMRGNHGHRREIQLFYIIKGEVEVQMETKQGKSFKILKDNDHLKIFPLTWTIFKFIKKNTEMIVFGTEEYDQSEYIYDYNEFLEMLK